MEEILIEIWHGEYIKNLKETGQKRTSYSTDVSHDHGRLSITGVSCNTYTCNT